MADPTPKAQMRGWVCHINSSGLILEYTKLGRLTETCRLIHPHLNMLTNAMPPEEDKAPTPASLAPAAMRLFIRSGSFTLPLEASIEMREFCCVAPEDEALLLAFILLLPAKDSSDATWRAACTTTLLSAERCSCVRSMDWRCLLRSADVKAAGGVTVTVAVWQVRDSMLSTCASPGSASTHAALALGEVHVQLCPLVCRIKTRFTETIIRSGFAKASFFVHNSLASRQQWTRDPTRQERLASKVLVADLLGGAGRGSSWLQGSPMSPACCTHRTHVHCLRAGGEPSKGVGPGNVADEGVEGLAVDQAKLIHQCVARGRRPAGGGGHKGSRGEGAAGGVERQAAARRAGWGKVEGDRDAGCTGDALLEDNTGGQERWRQGTPYRVLPCTRKLGSFTAKCSIRIQLVSSPNTHAERGCMLLAIAPKLPTYTVAMPHTGLQMWCYAWCHTAVNASTKRQYNGSSSHLFQKCDGQSWVAQFLRAVDRLGVVASQQLEEVNSFEDLRALDMIY